MSTSNLSSTTTSTASGSTPSVYVDPYSYGNYSGNNIVSNIYTSGFNVIQGVLNGSISLSGDPVNGLALLQAAATPFDPMGGWVIGDAIHLGYLGAQYIQEGNASTQNAINQAYYQSAQSWNNLVASQLNQTDSYAAQPSPGLAYEPGNNVYTYSNNGSQLISQQYLTSYTGSTLFGDTSGVFNEQQGSPINQNPNDAINTLFNDGFFNGSTNTASYSDPYASSYSDPYASSYSDPYASSYSDPYASSYSDSYGASVGVSGDTSVASSSYNGGGSSYGGGSSGYAYGGSGS